MVATRKQAVEYGPTLAKVAPAWALLLRRDYPSDGYHRLRDLEDQLEEEQSRRGLDAGELISHGHVFKLYCLSHVFKAAFRWFLVLLIM